jgi:hypothetical protein
MRRAAFAGIVMVAAIPVAALAQMDRGHPAQTSGQLAVAPPDVDKNSLYAETEYVSGHEGFGEKKKGQLAVTADGVAFFDNKGRQIFTLPIGTIPTAEHTRDIRDPRVGKKLLFGALAGDRKQDFLTLTIETDSTAEGVVFKVKQNVATGIAAKINFYVRKAQGNNRAPDKDAPATATADAAPTSAAREVAVVPAVSVSAPAPEEAARPTIPPILCSARTLL